RSRTDVPASQWPPAQLSGTTETSAPTRVPGGARVPEGRARRSRPGVAEAVNLLALVADGGGPRVAPPRGVVPAVGHPARPDPSRDGGLSALHVRAHERVADGFADIAHSDRRGVTGVVVVVGAALGRALADDRELHDG